MTPRAAPRARRSHAERTAETRAKVMGAVVECIAEGGFQRATAAEITRRAGVSWGAVQHHFGDKEGILDAVVAESFERFAERLSDVELEGLGLEARVEVFVARAWEHFGSPEYRSTFEILLNHASAEGGAWEGMLHAWNETWSRFFSSPHLGRRDVVSLQLHAISLLSGLATTSSLRTAPRLVSGPLALLRETLIQKLSG